MFDLSSRGERLRLRWLELDYAHLTAKTSLSEMAPKEYNLTLDSKLSGKRKDWETFHEQWLTKLLDNGLECVTDYGLCFFNAIQASQKPGGEVQIPPPPQQAVTSSTVDSTPVTARRLATGAAGPASGAGASDGEEDGDSAGSANSGDTVVLHLWMLNDPKYEGLWIKVMKDSPTGDMHAQCKDVRNALLAANHHKYNDKQAMGAATQAELTSIHT